MHPVIKKILEREKVHAQDFRISLKKAFDILGNVYAPIFFCTACLVGIALPLLAWKSGSVINALLGARGIGVITHELSQGIWVMVVALAVFFVGQSLLARLEGKMREVFLTLVRVCEGAMLLVFMLNYVSVFLVHVCMLLAWRMNTHRRVRMVFATVWFAGLVWLFFSLATDVALRVSTLGEMVSVLAISATLYCTVTHKFFRQA